MNPELKKLILIFWYLQGLQIQTDNSSVGPNHRTRRASRGVPFDFLYKTNKEKYACKIPRLSVLIDRCIITAPIENKALSMKIGNRSG